MSKPVVLSDCDIAFLLGKVSPKLTCECTQEAFQHRIDYAGIVDKRNTTLFRHSVHTYTHICDWCRLLKYAGLQAPVSVSRNECNRTTTLTPLQDETHEPSPT